MVTLTGTEFNRSPSAVKRRVLDSDEPVVVMEHSKPSLVVLRYDDYAALAGRPLVSNLAEWLRMDEDIDFEPEPIGLGLQVPDL